MQEDPKSQEAPNCQADSARKSSINASPLSRYDGTPMNHGIAESTQNTAYSSNASELEPSTEKTHTQDANNHETAPLSEHDKPYSCFTPRQKIFIILTSTLGAMFSGFTTNIYFPAISTIASDLHVSINKINLTITTYMIFQAIAPSFISSITDVHGRRPTYVIGFIIYMFANLGLGLNNSYAGLLVLRCIQSCGSSGLVTLNQATIADVVTSAERGKYIGITSIAGIVAPSVAPIIGGVLAQYLGWHSIFWFLLILSGVYLVPLLLWFPETSRKVVGDGSTPPPKWNKSVMNIIRERKAIDPSSSAIPELATKTKPPRKLQWPNPKPTLQIFLDKESFLILLFASIAYASFYAISATLTVQFHEIYNLNSTLQGLLFLPQAIGSILSAITNSFLLDKNYLRHARLNNLIPNDDGNSNNNDKKNGKKEFKLKQHSLTNFPIEKARLEISIPMFMINSLFMIVYGWMLQYRIHIAGPIIMLVLIGYTTLAGFNGLSILNIDINRHRASSASAAANLSRCLLGAGMTAVVNPMIEWMGRGWCFTFTALVQLGLLPCLWVVWRYGVVWRGRKEKGGSGGD